MAHIKIIDPSGWSFERPTAQLIKVSSRGLVGSDRSEFLKTASAAFLPFLDSLDIPKDVVPVHHIAVGATEAYGPNRNGDGFKEATCKAWHHTFTKSAKLYRNHANKDPKNSFGVIKLSAYNDQMRRIELLAFYNATKEAAARTDGHVADREIEKLEKGEDLPGSMACRVPFDVCSSCKNKARTRNEYCGPQTCKHGGCRDNLAKVASDGHILHVDNPDPHFFDYSYVFRPADRTAYGTRADYLQKAASALQLPATLSTAPLAVCLSQLDSLLVDNETRGQIKLAVALALIEQRDTVLPVAGYRGCDPVTYPELTATQMQRLDRPGSEKCAAALAALADQAVVLDFKNFANWMDKSAFYPVAAKMLPHIFTHIATRDDAETFLQSNPFRCVTKHASADGQALARELRIMSLSPSATQERAIVSAIKSASFVPAIPQPWSEKLATAAPGSLSLAEAYAMYKLAALVRMADRASVQDFDLTSRLILGQNRV